MVEPSEKYGRLSGFACEALGVQERALLACAGQTNDETANLKILRVRCISRYLARVQTSYKDVLRREPLSPFERGHTYDRLFRTSRWRTTQFLP